VTKQDLNLPAKAHSPILKRAERAPKKSRKVAYRPGKRAFVFLQGPPGPLFERLAHAMRSRGVVVERINICAGDRLDWRDAATSFRGRFRDWPNFFDNFVRQHGITDILMFGDCRPYHVLARRLAALRGIRTHVLEEGYVRPHWMTLELDGVNGHSRLRRDKEWFIEQARALPPEPELPPVTASFRRRVRDTLRYYTGVQFGRLSYPHFRSHRPGSLSGEAAGWIWKYLVSDARARKAERTVNSLQGKRFFLLPLQLSGDYQIRNHSPFPDMQSAASYVIESFATHAPDDAHLLIKAHPLDSSFFNWSRFIRSRARSVGIADRVHFIDGGVLESLAAAASGMVCVNSTSATVALAADTPVCTLGAAIYKMPGLTFEGHLDQFWADPPPPEPGLYAAFRRVLVDNCLVRGGLASESAVTTLVENMADKLCRDPGLQEVACADQTAVPR
jgi:capsular polysaccharide export protein